MSKLESIVPPLELCKLIPAGEFEDSVLVWRDHSCLGYYVSERFAGETSDCRGEQKFDCVGNAGLIVMKATLPAPTLAEILAELPATIDAEEDEFHVLSVIPAVDDDDEERVWIGYNNTNEKDANPATAALRLWLRIRREAGR
nr:MAG TPA: hypothetical protein [Caudoviricetes sp.]